MSLAEIVEVVLPRPENSPGNAKHMVGRNETDLPAVVGVVPVIAKDEKVVLLKSVTGYQPSVDVDTFKVNQYIVFFLGFNHVAIKIDAPDVDGHIHALCGHPERAELIAVEHEEIG